MKIVFATSNQHKLKEILSIVPPSIEILSLRDIDFNEELPETRDTIEGNSLQKAEYLAQKMGIACFSEDTGLEINVLNNEPGVYSARYAGLNATFDDNVNKVLAKMKGEKDRSARFKTVITYYNHGEYVQFEGVTRGIITEERRGAAGFGYDPIFMPEASAKTYAEMSLDEKNNFSHRKKSFDLFANHLNKIAV